MTRSKFIVVEHDAKKARLHFDLRFKMPKSKNWASYAVRKGVPLKPGQKVLAVRTHDHTESEALFIGTIKSGYGAGKLKRWDGGDCIIHKYSPSHIAIEFKGRKVKGLYHLINTGVMNKKEYKKQQYILFKGKIVTEWYGMVSRVPPDPTEEVEQSADWQSGPKLPWSKRKDSIGEMFDSKNWNPSPPPPEQNTVGRYSDRIGLFSQIFSQDLEIDDEQADAQQTEPLKWAVGRSKIGESFGSLSPGLVGKAPPSDTQDIESDNEAEDRKLIEPLPWSITKKIMMIRSKEEEYDHDD